MGDAPDVKVAAGKAFVLLVTGLRDGSKKWDAVRNATDALEDCAGTYPSLADDAYQAASELMRQAGAYGGRPATEAGVQALARLETDFPEAVAEAREVLKGCPLLIL